MDKPIDMVKLAESICLGPAKPFVKLEICIGCGKPMPGLMEAIEEIQNLKTGERWHPPCEGKRLIKIFAMNDCDWIAARSLEEARACYLEQMGGDAARGDEYNGIEEPHELTEEQLDKLQFRADDEEPKRVCSFREELLREIEAGHTFPRFFASTEV